MHTLTRIFATLVLTGAGLCAAPITFTTQIGNFENPPTGSPGTGSAVVIMDVDANILAIATVFSGLTGVTTASHLHCCVAVPNGNAGVATQTPSFIGFPLGVRAGTFANVYNTGMASTWNAPFIAANGGTPEGAEAALFAGLMAGRVYLNIHTDTSPGGEIRGFLAEVPEPASLSLVGAALLGIAFLCRQARRS